MNPKHEPRLLKEREMEQAMALWDACFVNTPAFTKWYFATRAIPERVMGLFEEGTLVSNTLMVPYRVKLRGKSVAAPYIVGAATLPEHRRKGHMERVLAAALSHMRDLGAGVTFLHPFRYGFYQRLGWERATSGLVYQLPAERLKRLCEPGKYERIKRGDGERLRPIYQAMTAQADPALLRGGRECEFRVEEMLIEGGFGLLGEEAYALAFETDGDVRAFELAYTRGEALYPLLGALAARPGAKKVTFMLPCDEALPPRFMDEAPPALSPYLMMRVADVEKAMGGLKLGGEGEMTLRITDALCPWNNGAFKVTISGGMASAAKTSAPADVAMDVSTLAMLISGYMDFDAARGWQLARILTENPLPVAAFTRTNGFVWEKY